MNLTEKEQIVGARGNYKSEKFKRVRDLLKTNEISLIEKEIRELFKKMVVEKRGSVIYIIHCTQICFHLRPDFSLNLYPEDRTFALNIHDWKGLVSEKKLKIFLTMAYIAKKHGFREKDSVSEGE